MGGGDAGAGHGFGEARQPRCVHVLTFAPAYMPRNVSGCSPPRVLCSTSAFVEAPTRPFSSGVRPFGGSPHGGFPARDAIMITEHPRQRPSVPVFALCQTGSSVAFARNACMSAVRPPFAMCRFPNRLIWPDVSLPSPSVMPPMSPVRRASLVLRLPAMPAWMWRRPCPLRTDCPRCPQSIRIGARGASVWWHGMSGSAYGYVSRMGICPVYWVVFLVSRFRVRPCPALILCLMPFA